MQSSQLLDFIQTMGHANHTREKLVQETEVHDHMMNLHQHSSGQDRLSSRRSLGLRLESKPAFLVFGDHQERRNIPSDPQEPACPPGLPDRVLLPTHQVAPLPQEVSSAEHILLHQDPEINPTTTTQ